MWSRIFVHNFFPINLSFPLWRIKWRVKYVNWHICAGESYVLLWNLMCCIDYFAFQLLWTRPRFEKEVQDNSEIGLDDFFLGCLPYDWCFLSLRTLWYFLRFLVIYSRAWRLMIFLIALPYDFSPALRILIFPTLPCDFLSAWRLMIFSLTFVTSQAPGIGHWSIILVRFSSHWSVILLSSS